jgi:long-chain acyl-CoA synthetase
MVNRGGEKIYSLEVENVISDNSKVLEVADYKVPKCLEFMETLPRNPTGKVSKPELRYIPEQAAGK